MCTWRKEKKSLGNCIEMNGTKIKEINEEETYRYLGMEESIKYDNIINKGNIVKEFKRRIRKIWSSELNARNKVIATNTFAIPLLTYSFGILNWTREEILGFDIITRKIMNMNNSLQRKSDTDRLVIARKKGGRGLRNIEDEFLCKVVGLVQHFQNVKNTNPFIHKVIDHEKDHLITINNTIRNELNLINDVEGRNDTIEMKRQLQELKIKNWEEKAVHGYFLRKLREINQSIDYAKTWGRLKSGTLTSDVESYICSLQEQEVNTREAQKRHEKDILKKQNMNSSCRMCKNREENLQHILGVCPAISTNLYLNSRHNPVAETVYFEFLKRIGKNDQYLKRPVNILLHDEYEIWWDQKVSTPNRIPHNKPDIIIWNNKLKYCQIIDISVPLDFNIEKKNVEKRDNYMALVSELQRVYRDYKYDIVATVIGPLVYRKI